MGQTDFLCSKAFNWSEICTLYVPCCQTQIHINNGPGRLPGLLWPSSVLLKPWSISTQNLRCVLCRCLSVSQMYSVKMSILQSIAPLHVDHFSSGLFLAWWLQYGAGLQLAESRMVKLVLIKETSHKGIEKLMFCFFFKKNQIYQIISV